MTKTKVGAEEKPTGLLVDRFAEAVETLLKQPAPLLDQENARALLEEYKERYTYARRTYRTM